MERMPRVIPGCALALFMLAAAGCGDSDIFEPPTGPTPDPTTRTFSDTLTPNSARIHPFATVAGGTVTATLTAIPASTAIGMDLGTWNGNSCHIIIAKTDAALNSVVIGTVASAGDLCVRVYDVGQLTAGTAYTVTVVHP
jgi:hypothetical protein